MPVLPKKPFNPLSSRVYVSQKLRQFLGNKQWKYSRLETNREVTKYIKDNNLLETGIIHPDDKLSDLLNYQDYVDRVERKRVAWTRRNRLNGETETIIEDDPKLTYSVMQHLLAKHYLSNDEGEYIQINYLSPLLSVFLNGRLPYKYVHMEILERLDSRFDSKQLLNFVKLPLQQQM